MNFLFSILNLSGPFFEVEISICISGNNISKSESNENN